MVLNLEAGTYFRLNPVASDVLQLLESGAASDLEGLVERIADVYEVGREVLREDLAQLINDLTDASIVTAE